VTDSIHPAVEAAAEVESAGVESAMEPVVSEELARRLVEQARTEGLSLIGPGGLLGDLTKKVLETSLEGGADRSPRLRPSRCRGPQPG
jgi:putative transposase